MQVLSVSITLAVARNPAGQLTEGQLVVQHLRRQSLYTRSRHAPNALVTPHAENEAERQEVASHFSLTHLGQLGQLDLGAGSLGLDT